jgi:hypothetical protein
MKKRGKAEKWGEKEFTFCEERREGREEGDSGGGV